MWYLSLVNACGHVASLDNVASPGGDFRRACARCGLAQAGFSPIFFCVDKFRNIDLA